MAHVSLVVGILLVLTGFNVGGIAGRKTVPLAPQQRQTDVLLHPAKEEQEEMPKNMTILDHLDMYHGKHGEPPGLEPKDPSRKFSKIQAFQGKRQKEAQRIRPPNYWAPNIGRSCVISNPPPSMECTIENTYCGYYEACPKCVCRKGFRSVEAQGIEYCIPEDLHLSDRCEYDLQCPRHATCFQNTCSCQRGYKSKDRKGCTSVDNLNEGCAQHVGCGQGLTCAQNNRCKACALNCASCLYPMTCHSDGCQPGYHFTTINDEDFCVPCDEPNCKDCVHRRQTCETCLDGYFITPEAKCEACRFPCKTCHGDPSTCTSCYDDHYMTFQNQLCKRRVAYGESCTSDGQHNGVECDPAALAVECRDGVCQCKMGYEWTKLGIKCEWNKYGHGCIHSFANLAVQVGGECHFDRHTFIGLPDVHAACAANSDILKICDVGLDCVSEHLCKGRSDPGFSVSNKRCRRPLGELRNDPIPDDSAGCSSVFSWLALFSCFCAFIGSGVFHL